MWVLFLRSHKSSELVFKIHIPFFPNSASPQTILDIITFYYLH